jgi:Uncharacterized protein conserved in bacteria (DUF2312)
MRAIVEHIQHIEEEIKELNEGKREIFQEAKSSGFDGKVIREIVRLKARPEGADRRPAGDRAATRTADHSPSVAIAASDLSFNESGPNQISQNQNRKSLPKKIWLHR